MISIRINTKSKKVIAELKQHNRYFKKGIIDALHEIGNDVVLETRRLITTGNKTGRIYVFRSKFHQASAPGEAPANRTGRLKDSVDYLVHSQYKMEVGESAPYAKYLEDGTTKMEPRPHLITAVRNKQIDALNALGDYVAGEIGIA